MSARLDNAMYMAASCWEKAMRISPIFVMRYLAIAEQELTFRKQVQGDFFCKNCKKLGLYLPPTLDSNTWASGVTRLEEIGWITALGKVVPTEMHNHMPLVTLWKSNIYWEDCK
jgi:hypothetical protein